MGTEPLRFLQCKKLANERLLTKSAANVLMHKEILRSLHGRYESRARSVWHNSLRREKLRALTILRRVGLLDVDRQRVPPLCVWETHTARVGPWLGRADPEQCSDCESGRYSK